MKARAKADAGRTEEASAKLDSVYEAWKREKFERGLAQARDRKTLIPADKVWRELGLER